MQTDIEPLVETAVFGKRLEDFFDSDIGKFLLQRAQDDIDSLTDRLKTISPWRRHAITQIQARIRMMEQFQLWISSAVVEGIRATEALEDQ